MATFGNTNQGFGGTGGSGGGGGGGGSISFKKLCSIPAGFSVIDISPKLGYNSAFYNYTIYDCTNSYSGVIAVNWNPSTNQISWNETSTVPIGVIPSGSFLVDNLGNFIVDNLGNFIVTTQPVALSFTIVGNDVNLVLYANNTSWKASLSKILLEDCCTSPYVSSGLLTTQNNEPLLTESNDNLITE